MRPKDTIMTSDMHSGFDDSRLDGLFEDMAPRLAHMRDVGGFAADLAASFGLPHGVLLARSAMLHDIGYAPALHRFNYHPLDGAIFLEQEGEHPWVVEGVLRHSWADRKAALVAGMSDEYGKRPPLQDAAWLVRAVTLADWRANGVGGRASFARRMQDIAERNPDKPGKVSRAREMVKAVRDDFLDWATVMQTAEHPLPWVFCDVDNTLIRPGDPLSAVNRAAVHAYIEAGGRFSLATGKHPKSILPILDALGVDGVQIASNGTCLLDKGRTVVLRDLGDRTNDLVARLEAMGLPICMYKQDGIEPGRQWTEVLSELFDRYGEIRPENRSFDGPVYKVLAVADDTDPVREERLRQVARDAGVDVCRSDRHFLEFVPTGVSKGSAMRTVTEQHGWPLLHTLALGDSENDEMLFALCGLCAAVANAPERMRTGADWVIPACTDNGVARMLDIVRTGGGWRALSSALALS